MLSIQYTVQFVTICNIVTTAAITVPGNTMRPQADPRLLGVWDQPGTMRPTLQIVTNCGTRSLSCFRSARNS